MKVVKRNESSKKKKNQDNFFLIKNNNKIITCGWESFGLSFILTANQASFERFELNEEFTFSSPLFEENLRIWPSLGEEAKA